MMSTRKAFTIDDISFWKGLNMGNASWEYFGLKFWQNILPYYIKSAFSYLHNYYLAKTWITIVFH